MPTFTSRGRLTLGFRKVRAFEPCLPSCATPQVSLTGLIGQREESLIERVRSSETTGSQSDKPWVRMAGSGGEGGRGRGGRREGEEGEGARACPCFTI